MVTFIEEVFNAKIDFLFSVQVFEKNLRISYTSKHQITQLQSQEDGNFIRDCLNLKIYSDMCVVPADRISTPTPSS